MDGIEIDTKIQVEFGELEESSMLASTIAWDNSLSVTWEKAIDELQATMQQVSRCLYMFFTSLIGCPFFVFSLQFLEIIRLQVSSNVVKLERLIPETSILGSSHVPDKTHWDLAVRRALQIIDQGNSALTKVQSDSSYSKTPSISVIFLFLCSSLVQNLVCSKVLTIF